MDIVKFSFSFVTRALAVGVAANCLLSCAPNPSESMTKAVDLNDDVVKQIRATYGVNPYLGSPYYQHDWDDYASCGPKSLKTQLKEIEARLGINRYELFTVAIGEGLGFRFDYAADEERFLSDPVSGFGLLGADFFGDELSELRRFNLLPPNFKQIPIDAPFLAANGSFRIATVLRSEEADQGRETKLRSANFVNLREGIFGFAALYANRARMFLEFAKQKGVSNPTPDQRAYWTYYFYQNPSLARQAISSRGLEVRFLGNEADSSRPKGIPMKSLKRVATMRHAMAMNALDLSTPCRAAGGKIFGSKYKAGPLNNYIGDMTGESSCGTDTQDKSVASPQSSLSPKELQESQITSTPTPNSGTLNAPYQEKVEPSSPVFQPCDVVPKIK